MSTATPHAEARRLLDKGFKLCALHPQSKQPVGDAWQLKPIKIIDPNVSGYGMHLAANNLCSIDPDNLEPARAGLARCGFNLEELMQAGVRTSSTRPTSGGRSTFKAPPGLDWIKFASKARGTILELRAATSNLQDCLPGTVYRSKSGAGPYVQQYSNGRTFDNAPDLPPTLLAWWKRLADDVDFLWEQQRLLCGPDAFIAVSSGDKKLAYSSPCRVGFNAANDVPEILERHCYITDTRGRWAPPTASGAPSVRLITGHTDLWQSDHASDPLNGTFDAWTASVVLDHGGDLDAAEAAWEPIRTAAVLDGFGDVALPLSESKPPPIHAVGQGLIAVSTWPTFKRKKTGEIEPTINNTVKALGCSDMSGFQLRHDTFREELTLAPHDSDGWRSFKDTDYTELALRLERKGFLPIGTDRMRDAVAYVAGGNAFDSAQYWLSLQQWDDTPRVERFLVDYFAATDTPYTRAVSLYLWSALAGRVLEPGVKADMVPVAVGAQGARKSTAVAAMVPSEDFFLELDLGVKDDDQARLMRGKLIIELGELKGLRTRDAEHIKAFITRRHETWTPKYKEMQTRYARRSVFFGTSNKDDFLADETGNRRWLPFNCGQCDPDGITRDREQLWAEARELFKAHGVLHREAERLAQAEHEAFAAHDDWDNAVSEWLRRADPFTRRSPDYQEFLISRNVLAGAIGLADAQQTPQLQQRIKTVLIRLGYTYASTRIDGQKTRVFKAPSLF